MAAAPPRVICDSCHRPVPPHAHYIVRIDVFADPTVPSVSGEDLEEADYSEQLEELLEQMKDMSPEELQDDVHRRLELRLCRPCQKLYLQNPMPQLRPPGPGKN